MADCGDVWPIKDVALDINGVEVLACELDNELA